MQSPIGKSTNSPSFQEPPVKPILPSPITKSLFSHFSPFLAQPSTLDLPLEKIDLTFRNNDTETFTKVNDVCTNPVSGDFYVINDQNIWEVDSKNYTTKIFTENIPDADRLLTCIVDLEQNLYISTNKLTPNKQGIGITKSEVFMYSSTQNGWKQIFSKRASFLSLSLDKKQRLHINSGAAPVVYFESDEERKFENKIHSDVTFFYNGALHQELEEKLKSNLNFSEITLGSVYSITFDNDNNMYLTDTKWDELFKVTPNGKVSVLPPISFRPLLFSQVFNFRMPVFRMIYNETYGVLLRGDEQIPSWVSTETGLIQYLTDKEVAHKFTVGKDGNYFFFNPENQFFKIQLSKSVFQPQKSKKFIKELEKYARQRDQAYLHELLKGE